MAIGDWLGSLFGGTPTYTPQPGGTGTPPGTLAGLLDPRGIREQAAYAGLGALSQGLLAAGMRRPAGSPSPLPQALGAFQPAYQGALQSGYQTAGAEQQLRQRQEQEQQWQAALQAATPAERTLMQQMGREQWAQMQGQVEAARRAPRRPQVVTNPVTGAVSVFDEDEWRRGQQPGATPPVTGQPPVPGGTPPGGAPSAPAMPSSGNPVIDATLNQIRPSESGNNPAAVSTGRDGQPILDRNGQPLAGGLYQFTTPTWEGVRARHPELNLTPDGRFDAAQSHRAAQAHAADIVRDLASYIGRRGPNGEIIDEAMLIRGAWAGGVEGVRRYIDSGGRRNPADVNGTSIGGYFTGQQLRGGGGTGGGTQSPAVDPGFGRGGTQVTMTPGAIPPPAGTATVTPRAMPVDAPPAAGQGDVAQGTALIAGLARPPQPPPQAQAPQAQPPQAQPPAAPPQPRIPGLTQLMPGRPPPVGEPVQVVGPNGQPIFVTREQAISQGMTPYHAPPAAPAPVQIMTPKGPQWVTREQALGQPSVPSAGMSVTTIGPDGNPIRVQVGGTPGQPGDMTAPTARALEEQITANTARLERLNTIASRLRPEYLQLPGQADAWSLAALERAGRTLTPEQATRLREFTEFRGAAFRELNETIREMSGTAVSASEGARVLQSAPNVDSDSPSQFQSKLNDTIRAVRLANARLHWYRRNGIQASFRGGDSGPVPLSNMPAVIAAREDALIAEHTQPNVAPEVVRDRVRRQLIQEFGLE